MSVKTIAKPSILREILAGCRSGLPVAFASAPFGLLFGTVAVQNGFSPGEAVFATASIFGGASQMVGIELFGHHVAPWLVVLSIFAVNFRHILYSAAVGRRISHWPALQQAVAFFFLTDPQYAQTEARSERTGSVTFAWYMGMALSIYACWVIEGIVGVTFGNLISDTHALGIDFLLPVYFLGLVMSFRSRPLFLPVVIASSIASVLAYKLVGSPWHVSIGAIVGILFAAAMPLRKAAAS